MDFTSTCQISFLQNKLFSLEKLNPSCSSNPGSCTWVSFTNLAEKIVLHSNCCRSDNDPSRARDMIRCQYPEITVPCAQMKDKSVYVYSLLEGSIEEEETPLRLIQLKPFPPKTIRYIRGTKIQNFISWLKNSILHIFISNQKVR